MRATGVVAVLAEARTSADGRAGVGCALGRADVIGTAEAVAMAA